jgi:hypothetical protein
MKKGLVLTLTLLLICAAGMSVSAYNQLQLESGLVLNNNIENPLFGSRLTWKSNEFQVENLFEYMKADYRFALDAADSEADGLMDRFQSHDINLGILNRTKYNVDVGIGGKYLLLNNSEIVTQLDEFNDGEEAEVEGVGLPIHFAVVRDMANNMIVKSQVNILPLGFYRAATSRQDTLASRFGGYETDIKLEFYHTKTITWELGYSFTNYSFGADEDVSYSESMTEKTHGIYLGGRILW